MTTDTTTPAARLRAQIAEAEALAASRATIRTRRGKAKPDTAVSGFTD